MAIIRQLIHGGVHLLHPAVREAKLVHSIVPEVPVEERVKLLFISSPVEFRTCSGMSRYGGLGAGVVVSFELPATFRGIDETCVWSARGGLWLKRYGVGSLRRPDDCGSRGSETRLWQPGVSGQDYRA